MESFFECHVHKNYFPKVIAVEQTALFCCSSFFKTSNKTESCLYDNQQC